MRYTNFIFVLLILSFTQSCFNSNEIYFDLKSQKIKSCNRKGINCIYIENDSLDESYKIEWEDITTSPPIELSLNTIVYGYLITKNWEGIKINTGDFKLKANSKYRIERVQGDASACQIEVYTNNLSKIVEANVRSCR